MIEVIAEPTPDLQVDYRPQGNILDIFYCQDKEILVEGAAGTGKSRGILEKLDFVARKYARCRIAILRKTRRSLTQSTLVTYEEKVLPIGSNISLHSTKQQYLYPNGSVIVVGGMDKPEKILSSEYDIIYYSEATEGTLEAWETLIGRLRNGVIPYQQIIADVNPSFHSHWLNQRALAGLMTRIKTTHRDNPLYWNEDKVNWTQSGREYVLGTLHQLTGVRRLRYLEGKWATAEGIIYEDFNEEIHVIDSFKIPHDWAKYRVIDFGYTNPFVCQWWAVDYDGRLFMYRELYYSGRIVTEHLLQIARYSIGERFVKDIADHDAEDRATLEKPLTVAKSKAPQWLKAALRKKDKLQKKEELTEEEDLLLHTLQGFSLDVDGNYIIQGIKTKAADKRVKVGIEAVMNRLKPAGDGRPRIFYLRDSLIEIDESLKRKGKPTNTIEEYSSYIWEPSKDGTAEKEQPKKVDDHGVDGTRYMVIELDGKHQQEFDIWF